MSFLTQSQQVFFGRPLCLIPSASHVIQRLTQSLSSFRSTCPNHLNLHNHSLLLSLSILTATFPGRPELASTRMYPFWILLELPTMEAVSGDNWSYKSCKAPVKSSSPTNQHPAFYRPDALPVAQPTVSKH